MELASKWHGRQDILSAGMDGLEMETYITETREFPARSSSSPLRLRMLGIACCIKQPVDRPELWETMTTARNPVNSSAEETVLDHRATPDRRSLNILLVDDVHANRKLVQAYLKATPHQIDIAENGEIAVCKFVSGNYDLVFMDIQMPIMDGYAATKAIRKWQDEIGISPTPIVALTAYVLEEAVQKCLEAGCNALLAKPIKKAQLLDAINEYAEGVEE